MAEKRKYSGRETRYRGERPPKRRASTPPPPTPLRPEPVKVETEEGLPMKLKEGQALPTLPERQDSNLSSVEYQSIDDSGVLAASIDRSRQKWLTDGPFERYWTKPSKRKNQVEVQNPAKETMVKLGTCSMIVEPHVFEVTLFTIKGPQLTFLPPFGQSNPLQQPANSSYGPQNMTPPPYSPTTRPASFSSRDKAPDPPQPTLPPFREGFGQFGPQGLPIPSPASLPTTAPGTGLPRVHGSNEVTSKGSKNQEPKANTDPVIQMLAARAATNPDLKSLMKIVASGKATQHQLRDFQDHIDELNSIIQSRGDHNQPPQTRVANAGARLEHPNQLPTPMPTTHITQPAPIPQQPLSQYYSHAPQPLKSKASYPQRQDVSAIAFDLTGGSGDRFLIPKESILEYLPGGTQVLISFIVTRKGSTSTSRSYESSKDYYQPVTIRLSSHNPRTLDPLRRVVAPAEEVRKRMNDVMDKTTPAEYVFLATQLPRTSDRANIENAGPSPQPDQKIVKRRYSPPNFLTPMAS